jgi:hypothetical protein
MEQYRGMNSPINPPVPDINKVAASTECTGLIPFAVASEDEAENYQGLYGIHPQRPANIRSKK